VLSLFEQRAVQTIRAERRHDQEQVRQLVRLLREIEASEEAPPEAAPPLEQSKPRYSWSGLLSWGCLVWVAIVASLLITPVIMAAKVTREIRTDSSGVLLSAKLGTPVSAARGVTHHNLRELPALPEATLRSIRDCAFAHRGASHRLRVASLVRGASGTVNVAAADGSKVIVQPNTTQAQPQDIAQRLAVSARFFQPFVGEEELDLSGEGGCSFAILAVAPQRARLLQ